jgi:hypothetical protein
LEEMEISMKFKALAMILALTVVSYAQTATQAAPPATKDQSTQSDTKTDASSCQKMMEGKDGSCCKHDMAAKDAKEAMGCCGGKDAKSCKKMKGDKMAAACGDGTCCGKDMKDCCKPGSADEKKMAMACCGGSQCGMGHHDHGEEMK